MTRILWAALAALIFIATPARAEVAAAAPNGFLIQAEADVAASPEQIWRNLTQIGRWWNSSHTYSGDARRMRLDATAGGCWCERWADGSVQHGQVMLVMEHEGVRTLRLNAALGPLQALGAQGVLTFTITPQAHGAKLAMSYRVLGDPALGFEAMSGPVDGVMMEQFGRLIRLSTTGSPD